MAPSKDVLTLVLLHLKRLGWMLMACALPFSNVLMSIATIWMVCIVVLEKILFWNDEPEVTWIQKWRIPNDYSVAPVVVFALSIMGLTYTENYGHGMWDLRMKLPLLLWPLIGAWIKPLSPEHKKQVWGVFVMALVVAVGICLGVYLRLFGKVWTDVRQTSIFISHIRFGLMMALGVAVTWQYGFSKGRKGRLLLVLLVVLFAGYLIAIESLTGLFLIAVVLAWNSLFEMRKWSSVALRRGVLMLMLGVPLVAVLYTMREASVYFEEPAVAIELLPTKSAGGERYLPCIENPMAIRGEWVFSRIAPNELRRGWNRRTGLSIDEPAANGYPVLAIAVRYMAGLHLPKDSLGILQLQESDVQAILSGQWSPNQARQNGLQRRMEAIFFELAHYKAVGDPSGHSITQRWEFWRAARYIIGEHPWLGVGTGDTKSAFEKAYQALDTHLSPEHRLRAHNQYLTYWLTFGILGVVILVGFFVVAWRKGRWRWPLWSSFLLIVALSFISEDTLETQAGVSFVAFFYVWIRHCRVEVN